VELTCDDLMREVKDLEEALKTRPRVVSIIALGCMKGTATIYDMPTSFSPDDPDDSGVLGMFVSEPVYLQPGVQRVPLNYPVLKLCTSYEDTLGPAAVLSEIHRCIVKYLPACRSVVPCRWMDIIPRLCFGGCHCFKFTRITGFRPARTCSSTS
jgi:hypothetical protein